MAPRAGSRDRRVTLAVLAVALCGLLARLAFLGARVAHWDEARVGYWTLRYLDTGRFTYQPVIHGPFLQQGNRLVFSLLGPTDFSMRLVVALLGTAMALGALLFRDRLRGPETVALAGFLAFDPTLLYYSRFARSDLPLAAFMLLALGLLVRALDTRRPRYLHAGVLALALAVTTKENVLLYLAAWVGAAVLLLDHRLFAARGLPADWRARLRERLDRGGSTLRRWTPHAALAVVEFLVVVVVFYAPRTGANGGPGFDDLATDPTVLPAVVGEATLGSWHALASQWIRGSHQDHSYFEYLGHDLRVLVAASGAVAALAVVGYLVDRYDGERPRDLVAFAFYWGVASLVGYPVVADIMAPWLLVHTVVALAIPAAAGVGALYRTGARGLAADRRAVVGVVAVVGLLVVGQVAVVAGQDVYLDAQSDANPLVQYAQPAGDLKPTLHEMDAVSAANRGTDVLLYGDFLVANTSGTRKPNCSEWFNALPLPWYFDADDVTVSCARTPDAFEAKLDRSHPPIVVGSTTTTTYLATRLSGYDRRAYALRAQDTTSTNVSFFVDADAANVTAQGNP